MDKPIRYRDLLKIIGRYGVYEDKKRAKGSERLWVKEYPDGTKRSIPVTCHSENYVIGIGFVKAIRRRFSLTEQEGIPDKNFYL